MYAWRRGVGVCWRLRNRGRVYRVDTGGRTVRYAHLEAAQDGICRGEGQDAGGDEQRKGVRLTMRLQECNT